MSRRGRPSHRVVGARGLLRRGEGPEDDAASGSADLHIERPRQA
jgi:hypothetical protein